MANFVVIAVVGLVVGLAVGYIRKEKKKGSPCVGCPYGASCAKKANGCGCSGNPDML